MIRFWLLAVPLLASSAWAQDGAVGGEQPADASAASGAADDVPAPPETAEPTAAAEPAEGGRRLPDRSLTDEQRFEQGATLFEFGECESVIAVLGDFSLGGAGRDEKRLVEAHRMLSVCFFQLGRRTEAERELTQLLYLNPDYELDPFLTPPPVVKVYDDLKAELSEKLKEIRQARQKRIDEASVRTQPVTVLVEKTREVRSVPWITTLIPFGGAQYANGEPVKAVAFFIAQAASFAVTGGVFGLLQLVQPEGLLTGEFPPYVFRIPPDQNPQDPLIIAEPTRGIGDPILDIGDLQQPVATVLWLTQGVAFLLVTGVYAAGVTDALLSREEEILLSETREEKGSPGAPSEATAAAAAGSE